MCMSFTLGFTLRWQKKQNSLHTLAAVVRATLCETSAVNYHFWSKRRIIAPTPKTPHQSKTYDYVMWSLSQHPDDKQHLSITKICRQCCLIVLFALSHATLPRQEWDHTMRRDANMSTEHTVTEIVSHKQWEQHKLRASISKGFLSPLHSDAWLAVDT